jgi:uncharacterized protein (TIGR00255 family)
MTGFGEARGERDGLAVSIEIRTVNAKGFKLNLRSTDRYGALEPQIERYLRGKIKRGTVMVDCRIKRTEGTGQSRINADVLLGYASQLWEINKRQKITGPPAIRIDQLLDLPGVVDEEAGDQVDAAADWPLILETLEAANNSLASMRTEEGRAMADDLAVNCQTIAEHLGEIEKRTPLVVEGYRERLTERLNKILVEYQVTVELSDIVREVGIFTERSDIAEEIVRLKSHLEQFDAIMNLPESSGRKLEFVTQEMFRETNTIGSKGSDAEISRHVVEVKAAIERIREMVQNVE